MSQQCFSDVCYQLNIPEQTAQSGEGDIYFQISGPTSYSWIGLGQGSQMAGSSMFVIYTDGRGNVTLSTRQGTGHVEPEHDTTANVTLLEGSGVARGQMVANILCSNCNKWNGGSTDFTSSGGSWIYASRPGDSLQSTNLDEGIEQHADHGSFTWDYSSARGGNGANPFVARSSNPSSGNSSSSNAGKGNTSTGNGGVSQPPKPATSASSSSSNIDTIAVAHGTLAAIVFLAFFPSGAIFVRIPGMARHVWVHAGIQIFSYCCFVAAAGLGIYMATELDETSEHHAIIGMILLVALFFQPIFGLLHHSFFKKHQKRTAISHVHIWVGRVAIVLGMINGGLGIELAGDVEMGYKIAYGVVAGVMGVVYLGAIVYGEMKRRKDGGLKQNGRRK